MDLEVSPSCWGGIWVAESSSENCGPSAPGHCLPKLSSPKVGRPDYWGLGGILKLKSSSYCHWGKQKPPKGDKGSSHCGLERPSPLLQGKECLCSNQQARPQEEQGQACFVFSARPESFGCKQS